MPKKGYSLIECMVSALLIALTLTGLVNLFVAGKRDILHSRSRMTAGELGRLFLDPLQMQVRQDTWDTASNSLREDNYKSTNNPFPEYSTYTVAAWLEEPDLGGGIIYYPTYRVEGYAGLRKVILTLTWTEPSP